MNKRYNKYLEPLNINALNPMQIDAIDIIFNFKESLLLSPTGSGKTLAFLLPLISLINKNVEQVQILVLLPTRELTLQVESVFKRMQTGYKINACYGGHSMTVEKNNFKQAPKVLVGTPGRIDDHIKRNTFNTKAINVLVIDEFDKCLELGFSKEMKRIIKKLKLNKTILCSATDLQDIPDFTGIQNPKKINYISSKSEADKQNLSLRSIYSQDRDKLDSLGSLLKEIAHEPTIVFCNRKDAIDRIANYLFDHGFTLECFHGNLEQDERERALIKFRNQSTHILLCTDLASRGMDVDNIKNIVHYHLPHQKDVFVHRNGRTARMQKTGSAFLIFAPEEKLSFEHEFVIENYEFDNIERTTETKFETLYISKGKKDKINTIDIVGFFYKKIGLDKNELGKIDVKDFCVYVAIKKSAITKVLNAVQTKIKIKGKTVKIELAR